MPKTVKGARIRLRRTNELGVVPIAAPNDDHTSTDPIWPTNAIYIGELFINTNATSPGMWFRDSTGITQMATLDKVTNKLPLSQLTNNSVSIYYGFTSTSSITYTITGETQYVVVSGSSTSGDATMNIRLDNLESGVTVVYISVCTALLGGTTIIVNVRDSADVDLVTTVSIPTVRGICLMWNGSIWVLVSDTIN